MSDMTETNRTAPFYYSPSSIPRIIKSHVEELFKKDAPFRRGELRRNPEILERERARRARQQERCGPRKRGKRTFITEDDA